MESKIQSLTFGYLYASVLCHVFQNQNRKKRENKWNLNFLCLKNNTIFQSRVGFLHFALLALIVLSYRLCSFICRIVELCAAFLVLWETWSCHYFLCLLVYCSVLIWCWGLLSYAFVLLFLLWDRSPFLKPVFLLPCFLTARVRGLLILVSNFGPIFLHRFWLWHCCFYPATLLYVWT